MLFVFVTFFCFIDLGEESLLEEVTILSSFFIGHLFHLGEGFFQFGQHLPQLLIPVSILLRGLEALVGISVDQAIQRLAIRITCVFLLTLDMAKVAVGFPDGFREVGIPFDVHVSRSKGLLKFLDGKRRRHEDDV